MLPIITKLQNRLVFLNVCVFYLQGLSKQHLHASAGESVHHAGQHTERRVEEFVHV